MKVTVIKNNLKYRIPDYNKGRAFIPEIGRVINLSDKVAEREIKSGNVRKTKLKKKVKDE